MFAEPFFGFLSLASGYATRQNLESPGPEPEAYSRVCILGLEVNSSRIALPKLFLRVKAFRGLHIIQ